MATSPASGSSNAPTLPTVWLGHPFPLLRTSSVRVFSIVEIVLGVISIILQITAQKFGFRVDQISNLYFPYEVNGYCILAGVFCSIAGTLGIFATLRRTRSLLTATVVIGAISIVASIAAIYLSLSIIAYAAEVFYYFYEDDHDQYHCDDYCMSELVIWVTFEAWLTLVYLALLIISIILTTLTYRGLRAQPRQNNNRQQTSRTNLANDQLELNIATLSVHTNSGGRNSAPPPPYKLENTIPQQKSRSKLDSSDVQQI